MVDPRYTGMELSKLKANTGEEVELEAAGGEAEGLGAGPGAAGERKLPSLTVAARPATISLDFPSFQHLMTLVRIDITFLMLKEKLNTLITSSKILNFTKHLLSLVTSQSSLQEQRKLGPWSDS